jgi:hypothetical protein
LELFFFAVSVLVPKLPSTVKFIPDQCNMTCYPANSKVEYKKRLDFSMCRRLDTLSVSSPLFCPCHELGCHGNMATFHGPKISLFPALVIKDVGSTDGRTDSKMRDFPYACMNQCYQCIFYTQCYPTMTLTLNNNHI